MKQHTHLLFICSKNQWRSPTAEAVWRKRIGYHARSAGTSSKAKKTVSEADVIWADMIFVMEKKHKSRLRAEFGHSLGSTPLFVLDIPDEYQYMDEDLIAELDDKVGTLLSDHLA